MSWIPSSAEKILSVRDNFKNSIKIKTDQQNISFVAGHCKNCLERCNIEISCDSEILIDYDELINKNIKSLQRISSTEYSLETMDEKKYSINFSKDYPCRHTNFVRFGDCRYSFYYWKFRSGLNVNENLVFFLTLNEQGFIDFKRPRCVKIHTFYTNHNFKLR